MRRGFVPQFRSPAWTNSVKRVFLLGYPIAHSLSPAMQNAAFRALDLNWRYELLETPHEDLRAVVTRLRANDCAGANVTIPHKQAVIEWLDELGEDARRIGAVNTIVKRADRLIGENTDGYGFLQSLRDAQVDARGAHVAILGAGGAAHAVAFAAADAGVANIALVNRTEAHAVRLADALRQHFPQLAVTVNRRESIKDATLIVNATSVGMSPDGHASPMPVAFPRDAAAFDLVYRPARTRFLRDAERAGARTIGGIGMLAHQGAAAFRLWTGCDAPVDVMTAAAAAALRETEYATMEI